MEMTQFLRRLQDNPNSSKLGALLYQREQLLRDTSLESLAIKTNAALLSSFEVLVPGSFV